MSTEQSKENLPKPMPVPNETHSIEKALTHHPDFFIYNNYNNHIINNKSDKSKILNLRITTRQ
jgi:hypothetical protein